MKIYVHTCFLSVVDCDQWKKTDPVNTIHLAPLFMPLHAVIIDREHDTAQLLSQLARHCPEVEVLAECISGNLGIEAINRFRPDIVFLEVEMPDLNGFQVLEAVEDIDFALVFVTAHDRFAIRAFRYSALDYLLKPVNAGELIEAVGKARKGHSTKSKSLRHLRQQYFDSPEKLPERIALPYQNGVTFVPVRDILYCKSDDNYTRFYLDNGLQHLVLKPLREIQELLEGWNFLRIHRQYLININRIKKFVRGEGCFLVMDNDQNIPVSRSQRDRLMEKFGWV